MGYLWAKGESAGENEKKQRIKTVTFILLILCTAVIIINGIKLATALENQVTGLNVSPDPVKLGYSTTISYTLGQESYVSILVYQENGPLARVIQDNYLRAAGTYKAYWDGTGNDGVLVPDGSYTFVVEARDSAGTVVGRAEKTALAARVPTVTEASDSPDPFNPLSGEQANITYTISSDAVVNVTILSGTTTVRNYASTETKPAGTHTIQWDGRNSSGVLMGDATYTYQIDAASPLVPSFKSTFKATTTLEKEPPQITNLTVTQNPFKLAQTSQSFKFNLSEYAGVTVKVYDSSNNLVKTVWDNVSRSAGAITVIWDGRNEAGNYVPEGTYNAVISAVDSFGKASADKTISFVAGYQPAINNTAVTPGIFDPSGDPAVITYNLSNDALVTAQILKGTSTIVRTITNKEFQGQGDRSVTWNGTDDAGKPLADGSYTVQITAVSPTVASFSSTVKLTVTIENKAPEITGFTLSPDPFKIASNSLSVKFTLSENATVDVNVYQGTTPVRNVVSGQYRLAGPVTIIWDGKDDSGNYMAEGTYSVVVKAVDAFGKSCEVTGSATGGYQPYISNVTHTPEPFNPAAGSARVGFNLSNTAKVTLTILKGTTKIRTIPAGTLSAGDNTVQWDGKDDGQQYVPDASYTYQVDAVSPTVETFKSTYKGTITVEGNNPVLTGLSTSPSIVRIGSTAFLKYTVSEPATVTAQILKAGDRSVVRDLPAETRYSSGSYSVAWDTLDNTGNPIASGDYILKFTAVDNFDNTGTAELAFQAGAVPVISAVYADPDSIDLGRVGGTTINFNISERSYVTVRVFNSTGSLVKTIYSYKELPAAPNTAVWDGKNSSGVTTLGTFTYKIDATSVIGSFRALQASGTVEITGTGGSTYEECTDCHTGYPTNHPMSNCSGCHGGNVPIRDCSKCHGGSHDYKVLLSFECTYCHNSTYSYKIPQHGDIAVIHTSPISIDCQKCHDSNLTLEHPRYKDPATGVPYDCNTCHTSTVAEVVYAIENKLVNCAACHLGSGHEADHTPTGIRTDCTKCHIDSLTQEHLNNPTTQTGNAWTCDTCHASTVEGVVYAIANSLKNCEACHVQASHEQLHAITYLDAKCTTCHINSLTQEHLNNPKTQTDPVTGQPKPWTCDTCHNSARLEVTWAVQSGDMNCFACHPTAHGINLAYLVPSDIPKYGGYMWSTPIDARIFNGESWMPAEFLLGGRVLISNRRAEVTGDAVWGFYQAEMAANGWTLISEPPTAGSDFFNVTFTKGTRKAVIWFYGGEGHTASPVLDAGYRIEILYK